ncbi:hypothetical protein MSG28_000513 [Choristoneura fumiferana]|uniref:Uncharacterized protein n=1 Tax=Choristoneura fumiferana TaxID=7141 RepID=A0ACC0K0Y9_CHOFU|nr:hypothetical protein MSG28_000513 [Choristoneura fumiferana]
MSLNGDVCLQSYAASAPPKVSSAPAHTTLQRSVRAAAAGSGSPARVIPRFHFPKGRPPPAHQQDHAIHKVQSAFATFPNSQSCQLLGLETHHALEKHYPSRHKVRGISPASSVSAAVAVCAKSACLASALHIRRPTDLFPHSSYLGQS